MRYKYRAWHKLKKQMVSHHEIEYIDFRDGHICHRIYIGDGEATEDIITGSIEGYELMQWTGLKGMGDVDVYEGDIVRCKLGCPHVVEWVEDHGGTYIGGMPTFYLSGLNPGYAWTGAEEVIGNIYENPELIGRQATDSTEILSESEAE